ncbi:hypothetical protein ACVWYF_000390 [Hymenobacter sp. UYAg731]
MAFQQSQRAGGKYIEQGVIGVRYVSIYNLYLGSIINENWLFSAFAGPTLSKMKSVLNYLKIIVLVLFVPFGLSQSGCAKANVECGHGVPYSLLRFQIVDDRTGLDWFGKASKASLDSVVRLNPGRYFTITLSNNQAQ